MTKPLLAGLDVLVLEDEFLIALDIEETCKEHGAAAVEICRTLDEAAPVVKFDVAVVDMRLGGESTLDFADGLLAAGRPFVFATGHADADEIAERFPGIEMVSKPYDGQQLIDAMIRAIAKRATPA